MIEKEYFEEAAKGEELARDFFQEVVLHLNPDEQLREVRALCQCRCKHLSHKHASAIMQETVLVLALKGVSWQDALEEGIVFHRNKNIEGFNREMDKLMPLLDAVEGLNPALLKALFA